MTPIWIYWAQGWENAPGPVKDCAESWERKNPDYKLNRLSSQTIGAFIDIPSDLALRIDNMRVQTQSDLYRLMLVHKFGGVWVDATLYCNRPLSTWLHLSKDHPVALFDNPGPDRLVSSWFVAANPDNDLIALWLAEMRQFLQSLPDMSSPTGIRKIILKFYEWRWSGSVQSTLNWWRPFPSKKFSIAPYFLCHYCYNRLALTDARFKALAKQKLGFPAEQAHLAQFILAGKIANHSAQELQDAPVHKLNWRKLPSDASVHKLLQGLQRTMHQ